MVLWTLPWKQTRKRRKKSVSEIRKIFSATSSYSISNSSSNRGKNISINRSSCSISSVRFYITWSSLGYSIKPIYLINDKVTVYGTSFKVYISNPTSQFLANWFRNWIFKSTYTYKMVKIMDILNGWRRWWTMDLPDDWNHFAIHSIKFYTKLSVFMYLSTYILIYILASLVGRRALDRW